MDQRLELSPAVVVGVEEEGLGEEEHDVGQERRREHAHHVVRELRIQDDEHERQRRAERRGERERHRQQLGELVREPVVSQVAGLVADRLDDEREDGDGEDERREQQVQLRDHPDGDAAADPGNGPVLRLLVGLRRGRRRPRPASRRPASAVAVPPGRAASWGAGARSGGRLLGHAARQRRGHRDRPREHRESGDGTEQDQQRAVRHGASVQLSPAGATRGAQRAAAPRAFPPSATIAHPRTEDSGSATQTEGPFCS